MDILDAGRILTDQQHSTTMFLFTEKFSIGLLETTSSGCWIPSRHTPSNAYESQSKDAANGFQTQ
jgi:hypothetical protein